MKSFHVIARLGLATVPFIAALACTATSTNTKSERSRSDEARTTAQSLTADEECQRLIGTVQPVFSATHFGGANGTVDLGNGASATIANSDGVMFDWSATIAIDAVIVRGSDTLASVHGYDPPATSDTRLSAPRDPDDRDRQLPLTSAKFCFLDRSGAPPVETPESSEPQACGPAFENFTDAWARTDAIIGVVDSSDPTELGRFAPTNETAQCTSSFPAPTVESKATSFHYDAWTFKNTTGADACVSISALTQAKGLNDFQVQVFNDSFDPQDLTAGYAAHDNNCRVCSLSVPVAADASIVVVVSGGAEGSAQASDGMAYRLAVGGCGAGTSGGGDGGATDGAATDGGASADAGAGDAGTGGADAGGGKTW